MALSRNPTRTRTIENNWVRDINRRWSAFTKLAARRLRDMNRQDLLINRTQPDSPFSLDPSRQRTYLAFLEEQIQLLLLETDQGPNWQGRYQLQAYERGLEATRAALIAHKSGLIPTQVETFAAQGLTAFTATPSLGSLSVAGTIHQEGLEFLYTRAYQDLSGWTDRMAKETSQILFDSFAQGQGIEKTVRQMVHRMAVSRSRARVIARTETNQAYARASIAEAERASEEIGKTVKLRWLTALDSRVRHSHASVHGLVMTPKRAYGIKATDGINCRCGLAPVIPRADTAKKRAKFKAEREQLLAVDRR